MIVGSGDDDCHEATKTITALNLVVQTGGSLVLAAGISVALLPESHVAESGYLRKLIDVSGNVCLTKETILASVTPSVTHEKELINT